MKMLNQSDEQLVFAYSAWWFEPFNKLRNNSFFYCLFGLDLGMAMAWMASVLYKDENLYLNIFKKWSVTFQTCFPLFSKRKWCKTHKWNRRDADACFSTFLPKRIYTFQHLFLSNSSYLSAYLKPQILWQFSLQSFDCFHTSSPAGRWN